MVDFAKILLELQLREANCRIQSHLSKGQKYAQFLSPMFLWQFPAVVDNQISVQWDSITGVFDRVPIYSVTSATPLMKWPQSIMGLEDGYFIALREVIHETEKALRDISRIDSTYVSHVIMVMAGWQEVVQAATSHMESANTKIYLARRKDMWRATKEYVVEVIKAHKQCDADYTKEGESRKQAIKAGDPKDLVVCLLEATCKAVHAQAERAMDIFLNKVKETLQKHIPISAQGPLIANALSTTFQFQMSVWRMIGNECICPIRVKHSNWCGLASIMQAIVEMFPNNCTIMFPPALAPEALFSSTFKLASSEEDDDDDGLFSQDPGLQRFGSDLPAPSSSGRGGFSSPPTYSSTPLPQGDISSLHLTRRGCPAVPLVHHQLAVKNQGHSPLTMNWI